MGLELNLPDRSSMKPGNGMTELLSNPTNLSIPAFTYYDFKQCLIGKGLKHINFGGQGFSSFKQNASSPLIQHF
jgi:hypothetical protein